MADTDADDGHKPLRERNTILEAIELMRESALDTAPTMIAFLYLCENEGLCISELADLAGVNMAAASRAGALLTGRRAADVSGALARVDQLGRVRALVLSDLGRELRDRIDACIAKSVPIGSTGDPDDA